MERDFKGVWIPAEIYLDKELSWTEKLLLIEIDSLDGPDGCFALNEHFAEHLGISKGRVSKLISKLIEKEYITSKIIYKKNSKIISKRILHTTIGYSRKRLGGIVENDHISIVENDYPPMVENDQENNTIYNNTVNNTLLNNNKKKSDYAIIIEEYTSSQELSEAIYNFIDMRKAIKAPMTDNAIKLLLKKLDKMATTEDEKIALLEQSTMNSWKGIFPLKQENRYQTQANNSIENLQALYEEAAHEENRNDSTFNPFGI